jgi:hypothetical protein
LGWWLLPHQPIRNPICPTGYTTNKVIVCLPTNPTK